MADEVSDGEETRDALTGPPRWVRVLGVIALVLAALFAGAVITGRGGDHGPGRHTPRRHAPSAVIEASLPLQ